MAKQSDRIAMLERSMKRSTDLGLGGLIAEDARTTGRHVRVSGRDLVNFGSCSYLGLELDPRLIEGAVEATRAHGIEFSSSRIFMSSPLYGEIQSLMEAIFEAPVAIAPTTTLAHLSALPVLVDSDDAIVLDHQVHASVEMASTTVRGFGTHVEVLPHDDLAALEERVVTLSRDHARVWYMADGIYSMLGSRAPIPELIAMLDRHPQMRLYVDDAHGMSWCGPRGSGSVLEVTDLHPQMILTTGLAKGFGTGGGVVVLPDEASRQKVQLCGPTLLFSGPLQPPILGAAIASAKIHLSDEIDVLQGELRERIEYMSAGMLERGLPLVSPPDSPVGFIATGPQDVCRRLCLRMVEDGLFTNTAQFPAAPLRRSGLRFLITRHQTIEDLDRLIEACDRNWLPAVEEAGLAPEDVYTRFGLEWEGVSGSTKASASKARGGASELTLERVDSIEKLRRSEWDTMLGGRGCLGSSAVEVFEQVFGGSGPPEDQWEFRYYVVRDGAGEPILATTFTAALWKADMLSPAAVSREVEARRQDDPYLLTQRVFGQGCLLSEDEHLWLRADLPEPVRRESLALLIAAVRADADELGCPMIVFRDLPDEPRAEAEAYESEGFLRMPAPDAHNVVAVPATDRERVESLSRDHRRHHRLSVEPFDDCYVAEVFTGPENPLGAKEFARLHALYEQVCVRSLDLNTFPLPGHFWEAIHSAPDWELVVLRPSGEPDGEIVGFYAAYQNDEAYIPLVCGLDYAYVEKQGLYRQLLRHALHRAHARGYDRVQLGFGASLEKRRFGARPEPRVMYVELDDHYALDALDQMAANRS